MQTKKIIDWETLWKSFLRHTSSPCFDVGCEPNGDACPRGLNLPDDCPLWASLEDAREFVTFECEACGLGHTIALDDEGFEDDEELDDAKETD